MLRLGMGTGKTIISLSVVSALKATGVVTRALVVAPPRVCRTVWRQQAGEWEHTADLTFSLLDGPPGRREKVLQVPVDITLINYEKLPWLVKTLKKLSERGVHIFFDLVVWDEVTYLKNSTSGRSRAAAALAPFVGRRFGMTGTQTANGMKDWHGQYLAVDKGLRLGVGKTEFDQRYFFSTGPFGREPFKDTKALLTNLIGDITFQANPDLELPPFTVNDIEIELTPKQQRDYDRMEEEFFLELDAGDGIEIFNQASLSNKCLQYANGAVYGACGPPDFHEIHQHKLDALGELIDETGDEPVLLAYAFRSDVARITRRYPDAVNLTAASKRATEDYINQWNRGRIKLLIGHPKSVGHGLNLQDGGRHLGWFGLTWALDLYYQLNARLMRQGQTLPVFCHRFLVKGTLDEVQRDRLTIKAQVQLEADLALEKFYLDARVKKLNAQALHGYRQTKGY